MRLIDADNAIHALGVFSDMEHGNKHFLNGINSAKEIINECVTIDVVPVVHGEWVLVGTNKHHYETSVKEKCSLCGRCVYRYDTELQDNYCPNCGARMDGEV